MQLIIYTCVTFILVFVLPKDFFLEEKQNLLFCLDFRKFANFRPVLLMERFYTLGKWKKALWSKSRVLTIPSRDSLALCQANTMKTEPSL